MIADIGIEEFRKRFVENTKIGNTKYIGTPFQVFNVIGENGKKFYGKLNMNQFTVTSNAILFSSPFALEGNIKPLDNFQTEIVYEIKPLKFGYYWMKYLPIVMLVVFNIILIIEKAPKVAFIMVNVFSVLIASISNLVIKYGKKSLENNFKKVFSIKTVN